MNIDYNGFIGIYNDVYPEGYCQHLISEFDRLEKDSAGSNRWQSEKALESRKNDYQIGLDLRGHSTHDFEDKRIVPMFLMDCRLVMTSTRASFQRLLTVRSALML